MEEREKWGEFVQAHLTVGNLLDGLILVTRGGDPIFSWGRLRDLNERYYSQFLVIFSTTSEEQESAFCQKGFVLQTCTDPHENKYIIYSKSFCSVYAVTRVNRSGIIACSLPNGVLVATYSFPCTSVKAVEIVEKACDLLRG